MNNEDNKSKTLVAFVLIVLFMGLCILPFFSSSQFECNEEDDSYDLEEDSYFLGNSVHLRIGDTRYKISFEEDYINIEHELGCLDEECENIDIEEYTADYKDYYYDFFDNLFLNSDDDAFIDSETIVLEEKDLSAKERKVFYEILGIEYLNDITYFATANSDNSTYKDRGYYIVEKEDGKYSVIVAMGEQNSSGYSMSILSIETFGKYVTIYVEEKEPSEEEKDEELSYPMALVLFDEEPIISAVYSVSKNEQFNKLD